MAAASLRPSTRTAAIRQGGRNQLCRIEGAIVIASAPERVFDVVADERSGQLGRRRERATGSNLKRLLEDARP
jgi:hypothetical protein